MEPTPHLEGPHPRLSLSLALALARALSLALLRALKGFSLRRQARPCLAAISSMSSITIRFSSICAEATPKYGAHSYWLGATSRWRVLSGMPGQGEGQDEGEGWGQGEGQGEGEG